MQVKRFVRSGVVAVALIVGLAGCSSGSSTKVGGISSAELVAKDSPKPHFEPSELKASPNSEVSFRYKNEGKVVHNFTLSFLGVDQDVQPGQTVDIKFKLTAPPKGLDYFTFYDKNYQGEGMQGQIKIS